MLDEARRPKIDYYGESKLSAGSGGVSYYQQVGGCRCCSVMTNASCAATMPFITCRRWSRARSALDYRPLEVTPSWNSHPLRRACRLPWVSAKYDMYGLIPVGLRRTSAVWCCRTIRPDELLSAACYSMDYRQRPAPTTDAETYEFINELGDKKITWCRLARCMSPDEPGHLPSVRRW